MEKLIIKCVVCNSNHPDHACYRMTAEEIAAEAKAACDAGAAVVHFHNPTKDGKPTGVEGWREGAKLIREACDVIIEHGAGGFPYSISAVRNPKREDLKIEHELGTEMIVVGLGIIDHTSWPFTDRDLDHRPIPLTRREMMDNYRYFRECGVKPRLEQFGTVSPLRNLEYFVEQGVLDPPYCVTANFGAMGSISGGMVGDPATVGYVKRRWEAVPEHLKKDVNMECSSYEPGPPQMLVHSYAIATGLHVRVGMEDLVDYWPGVPATGNAQLVERIVRIAKEFHREVATPAEARKMYGLPPL